MGFFGVPIVERKPWGILCLILNIVLPGVGTIVAGVKERETSQWIKGILQLLLAAVAIGFIWSVIDGIRIFLNSTSYVAPVAAAAIAAPVRQEAVVAADAPAKRAAPKSAKKAAKKSAKKAAKK